MPRTAVGRGVPTKYHPSRRRTSSASVFQISPPNTLQDKTSKSVEPIRGHSTTFIENGTDPHVVTRFGRGDQGRVLPCWCHHCWMSDTFLRDDGFFALSYLQGLSQLLFLALTLMHTGTPVLTRIHAP